MNASFLTGVVATVLLATTAAGAASGEDASCDRIEDRMRVHHALDIEHALTGEAAGCIVRGGALRLCSTVAGSPGADATSGGAEVSRACYRLECPDAAAATVTVADRFGTREVSLGAPRLLCVPAQ